MARAPANKTVEAQADDAPRWRVMEKSFIGHSLVEEGAEVVYEPEDSNGKPGEVADNLSPLNAAAQAIVDAQAAPHPDKTEGTKAKKTKATADAASAAVGSVDASKTAPTTVGGTEGGDLA